FVDHVDGAVQPDGREHRQADAQHAEAAAGRALVIAATAFLVAEQPVEALLQLAEGLVQVRRTLAIAASPSTAPPGVLIVRVAPRLIPSHSALHTDQAKDAPHGARPTMLPMLAAG